MRVALLVKKSDNQPGAELIPIQGVEVVDPVRVAAEKQLINTIYDKIVIDITLGSVVSNLMSNFDQFRYKVSTKSVIATSTVMKARKINIEDFDASYPAITEQILIPFVNS